MNPVPKPQLVTCPGTLLGPCKENREFYKRSWQHERCSECRKINNRLKASYGIGFNSEYYRQREAAKNLKKRELEREKFSAVEELEVSRPYFVFNWMMRHVR